MGLAAFNRMRLRRVEAMRPENIEKTNKKEEEKINEEKPVVEEIKEEVKAEPVRRGSNRKK